MGEIRSLNTVLAAKFDPDTINNALRAGPREIQDFLGWLFFGDDNAGGGVVGFDCTSSALTVTVQRGGALIYNAGAPGAASKWAWVWYAGGTQFVFTNNPTLPRYAAITLSWTQIPDTPVALFYEGSPNQVSTKTQRGSQAVLTKTEGYNNADPWTYRPGGPSGPALPAGEELLAYVYIPATSGDVSVVDVRRHLPGPRRRPYDKPVQTQYDVDGGEAQLVEVLAREAQSGDNSWASSFRWDIQKDLPLFVRGKGSLGGAASDDYLGGMFPMLIPGNRTWSRIVNLSTRPIEATPTGALTDIACDSDLGSPGTIPSARIRRLTTSTLHYRAYFPIDIDDRALKVTAAAIDYALTAFNGSSPICTVMLGMDYPGQATIVLASLDLQGLGTLTRNLAVMTNVFAPILIPSGARLFLDTQIQLSGGTATGQLDLFALKLTFSEGHQ